MQLQERLYIQTVAVSVNDIKLPVGFGSFHQPAVVAVLLCVAVAQTAMFIYTFFYSTFTLVFVVGVGEATSLAAGKLYNSATRVQRRLINVQYPLGCFSFYLGFKARKLKK